MDNERIQAQLKDIFTVIHKEQEIAESLKAHATDLVSKISELPEMGVRDIVGNDVIFGFTFSGLTITLNQDYVLRLKATGNIGKDLISYFLMNDLQMQALLYNRETVGYNPSETISIGVTPIYNASSSIAYNSLSFEKSLNTIDQIRVPLSQARSVFDRAVAHYVRVKMKPHLDNSEKFQA